MYTIFWPFARWQTMPTSTSQDPKIAVPSDLPQQSVAHPRFLTISFFFSIDVTEQPREWRSSITDTLFVCTVGVSSGLGGSTRCNRGYPSKRDLHSHVQRCHPDQPSGQGQPVVKMLWLGNLVSPANGSDESPPELTDTESNSDQLSTFSENDCLFQCQATMPEHNHVYINQPQHPILNCPWMQMPPPVMSPFYPPRFGHVLEEQDSGYQMQGQQWEDYWGNFNGNNFDHVTSPWQRYD